MSKTRIASAPLAYVLFALVCGTLLYSGTCRADSNESVSVKQIAPDEMRVTIAFDLPQFNFSRIGGYDYIRGSGMVYLPEAGLPGLPRQQMQITIPFGSRAERVEATSTDEMTLDGAYEIVPTQPPRILGRAAGPWTSGSEAIYLSDEPYPRDLVNGVSQGFMGDNRILSFYVSPFRWNPVTRGLTLLKQIELRVALSQSAVTRPTKPVRAKASNVDPLAELVGAIVANSEDVAAFAGQSAARPPAGPLLEAATLEEGAYEYVIITTQALAPYFGPLIDWKTQKGVPATCVTREWIEANYTGANSQEQIRNFIIDAYQTWGTTWVLIGGDTWVIPSRQVYAMDCEMGLDGNRIRADLYYSDLDGNWDANGVSPYGEVADSVDMYPDVIVGRAPAKNATEATVFVNKVITYEKNPPPDYALKMLLAGEILWDDPYTDAGIGLDMIDAQCIPPRFDPILKLYQSQGTESRESVLAAMSVGKNIILHDGHCNETVMGVGGSYLGLIDADTLSNGPRNFILNSIGCLPAAIDKDCIAEHFVNNPEGGCVAFIGNCRYGWGSPGNPGFGYSDVFQREFARCLFVDEITNLGLAHAESKAHFVPFARDANVYRWNEYQLNLLGDPEMPVWTDEPQPIVVTAPDSVISSGGEVRVVVEDASGVVGDAMVCLMNGYDLYLRGRTDLAGSIIFPVATASPDSLVLTVVACNRTPYQSRIDVISEGRLLGPAGYAVLDGQDGWGNPGEETDLQVSIKNSGSEAASGVWGVLRARDGRATVSDSTVYYGALDVGTSSQGSGSFRIELASSLINAEAVTFDLVLADTSETHWTSALAIPVATPVLGVSDFGMHDLLGDGDWIAEPGETVIVTLEISNSGLTSGSPDVHVTTSDPYFTVQDSIAYAGNILPGSVAHSIHRVIISQACPAVYVGMFAIAMTCPGGYGFEDTVYFDVGDLQFTDDCEEGEGAWIHSGSPDLWHLTTYRSHSGSSSWYFGADPTHTYVSSAHSSLVSQNFTAGDESNLSFWFWYDFTTYGVDGIYIILLKNGVPDTLDYMGSGGALNIVSRWVLWERPLDGVSPGETIAVKFDFKSDASDVAEGVYIDDISFTSKVPARTNVNAGDGAGEDLVFTVLPNPAEGSIAFAFSRHLGKAVISVYDIRGRHVISLVKPTGAKSVSWNLEDSDGNRVSPGIYLAGTGETGYTSARKIVVLR